MSYHLLHIFDYGCKLSKERGLLVSKKDGRNIGQIAIEDLRAVVVANEAVSISGNLISELLANDAMIVHCKDFKPVGSTIPLFRTYDAKVVLNQASANKNLNGAVWRRLLYSKVENCVKCLNLMGIKSTKLEAMFSSRGRIDESWCAREYWKHFFPAVGEFGQRRAKESGDSRVNALLNYGYGIMSAIIHRSMVVSGLNSLLGVNHKTYYKNTPLVYDVVEPFRAFVDYALYRFVCESSSLDVRSWAVFFGKFLRDRRVKKNGGSVKLLDASDACCESLANVYRYKKADKLWLPILN